MASTHHRHKGLDYHPSHLIIQALPIPPNAVRPSPTVNDEAIRSEDPLTKKMIGIMRMVKQYRRYMSIENTPDKIFGPVQPRFRMLFFYILTIQSQEHTKTRMTPPLQADSEARAGEFEET